MIDQLFSLVFLPFTWDIVLTCCCMVFVVSLFGFVRRLIGGKP